MRGKKAKEIRKAVYGEQSIKQPRKYITETIKKFVSRIVGKEVKMEKVDRGIIKNIGLLQQYQDAKRDYLSGR